MAPKVTPKTQAQENLLDVLAIAFIRWEEDPEGDPTDRQRRIVRDHMDKQMRRIEKMFGYIPGSWARE